MRNILFFKKRTCILKKKKKVNAINDKERLEMFYIKGD